MSGAAVAGALLLLSAACGSTIQTVPASEAPPVGGPSAAVAKGGLAIEQTAVGTVVTSDGFTVYRFDKDSAKPSKSTCAGTCAEQWPPVLGDGVPALAGVPQDLVGTIGRADGTQQLTLNGWPLYRFAEDTSPGDVKGEGVAGAWRAIGVNGKPASAAPAKPAATPAPAAPPAPAPATPAAPAPAATGYGGDNSGY
jgi:predicted lipoprotein with Yx(FWY)xxD motif